LAEREKTSLAHMPIAGFLSWLVPGLGHIYLGHRMRGLIFLIVITATFWTGVAVGSVQATVAPQSRKLWFIAQLCSGGNTLAALGLHHLVDPKSARSSQQAVTPYWASADVGVHYTGVAGLLNLLVILDAIGRAEPRALARREEREPTKGRQ